MAKKKWILTGVVAALAVSAAGIAVWWDPMLRPGSRTVEVYAVNDAISGEAAEAPGWFGRLLGMCDADAYYAEQDGRHLCLTLNGPLGTVKAERRDGRIVVTEGADRLAGMAAQDTGSPDPVTTLVLMGRGPLALIPVDGLGAAGEVGAPELG